MIALLCKASITWLKRSEGSLSYWAGLHFFNARCVRTLRSPTSSTTRGDGYERIAKGCMHKSGTLSGLVDHVWYHPGQSRTAREARWWWWWWLTFKRSSLKLGSDGWGWMRDWWGSVVTCKAVDWGDRKAVSVVAEFHRTRCRLCNIRGSQRRWQGTIVGRSSHSVFPSSPTRVASPHEILAPFCFYTLRSRARLNSCRTRVQLRSGTTTSLLDKPTFWWEVRDGYCCFELNWIGDVI